MKFLFSIFTILFALSSTAQTKVYNDPNAKTRSISGNFSKLSVSSGVELFLSQGNETSLAVSVSDSKYEERFKTEVVDGVLKIYYDNKGGTWSNDKNRKLKAYLSVKSLEGIKASAGCRVTISNVFNANDLAISVSSGAMMTGAFKANSISADLSSGAELSTSGSANKVTVSASSGASFKGFELVSQYCTASANSGASIRIGVQKELTASANSGGDITYKGTPTVNKGTVNSGGSVRQGK
jgi:hypothetical protein